METILSKQNRISARVPHKVYETLMYTADLKVMTSVRRTLAISSLILIWLNFATLTAYLS